MRRGLPRATSIRPAGRAHRWAHVLGGIDTAGRRWTAGGSERAQIHQGEPQVDSFYPAPDDVPGQPGQLLRSKAYATAVPDGARACRPLYTTTRDGTTLRPWRVPSSGVATEPTSGPRTVIAWGTPHDQLRAEVRPVTARQHIHRGSDAGAGHDRGKAGCWSLPPTSAWARPVRTLI
jgi:hypothetical protein